MKTKTNEIIAAIHNEFDTAADVLLVEMEQYNKTVPEPNASKIDRLKSLGFRKAKEVKEGQQVLEEKLANVEKMNTIKYYQQNYPLNKFITETQVEGICKKYGLVMGKVSDYTGFVPESKLALLEKFKLKQGDIYESSGDYYYPSSVTESMETVRRHVDLYEQNLRRMLSGAGATYPSGYPSGEVIIPTGHFGSGGYVPKPKELKKQAPAYMICAPQKDFDMAGKELKKFKLVDKPVPDPVVLQPVKGGYLIVCAWGDEASDPEVVNGLNN
jgi:hypothetical protein